MSLRSQFKTNAKAEGEGRWFTYGASEDGTPIRFKLARMGAFNKRYMSAHEEETAPFRALIDADRLPEETAKKINRNSFLRGILIAWEGVQATDVDPKAKAEPLEFNTDNANKLFDELPELYLKLREDAATMSNYLEAAMELDAKN